MAIATDDGVGQKVDALHKEIECWLELVNRFAKRARRSKDATELRLIEGFLRSARLMIEQIVEWKRSSNRTSMPSVESLEISLPSFPLPTKETRERPQNADNDLPQPSHIVEE